MGHWSSCLHHVVVQEPVQPVSLLTGKIALLPSLPSLLQGLVSFVDVSALVNDSRTGRGTCTGRLPETSILNNRHGNLPGMIAKIIVGDYHFNGRSWTGTSPVTIQFVQHLMQVDPDLRPHAAEVLKHAFLQSIDRSESGEVESRYSGADTKLLEGSFAGSYISSASSHKLGRFAPQCDSEFQFGSMRSVTSLTSPKGKQAMGSGEGRVLYSLSLSAFLSLSPPHPPFSLSLSPFLSLSLSSSSRTHTHACIDMHTYRHARPHTNTEHMLKLAHACTSSNASASCL